MSTHRYTRRRFTSLVLSTPFWGAAASGAIFREVSITDFGAVADDSTINTKAIQAPVDHLSARGGGTVLVPQGVFVSGAVFLPKLGSSEMAAHFWAATQLNQSGSWVLGSRNNDSARLTEVRFRILVIWCFVVGRFAPLFKSLLTLRDSSSQIVAMM